MKKKIVVLNVILIVYILSMSVGYAIFSEALTVKGVATTVDFYSGDNLPHTAVLRDLSNNRYHTATSVPVGLTYSEEIWNGNTYTLTYDKSPDIVLNTEDTLDFTISFINPTVLDYTEGLSSIDTSTPTLQQTNALMFNVKPKQLSYNEHNEVTNMSTVNNSGSIDVSTVISKTVVSPNEIVDATISIGIKSLSPYGDNIIKSVISYMLQGKRRYFSFIVNLVGTVEPLTLVVNPNGGIYSGNTSQSIFAGDSITLNTPTRAGYIFNGWTVSGEGSSISGNTFTMGTIDTTITANWTPITYKINYNCNGGSGSTTSNSHTYDVSKTLTSNKCYKITAGSSGSIYKFLGWSTSSSATTAEYSDGQSVSNLTTVNGAELNLYAIWSSNSIFTYTGSYNVLNDGGGNWRVKFLTGGTYTSTTQILIDAFLVGGGGGGASSPSYTEVKYRGAGGGGSGKTATHKAITLSASTYSITIGAGGGSNSAGGTTSAFNKSVAGGSAGSGTTGGSGGSGGGGGGYSFDSNAGYGGQFGNAGTSATSGGSAGSGQGSTTCEFGQGTTSGCDSGVTNYASGGSGGAGRGNYDNRTGGPYGTGYGYIIAGISAGAGSGGSGSAGGNATANTGSGGGGASFQNGTYGIYPIIGGEYYKNVISYNGGSGGSGIVVIRNAR